MNLISRLRCSKIQRAICSCIFISLPLIASSQVNRDTYDEIKDTIITKFNRNDFSAIYQLFDTSFQNKISATQLVHFLKGNQNSGKIVQASFQSEDKGMASYLVTFELRDMLMMLQLTADKKVSSFGLRNAPHTLLSEPPVVQTSNPRKSALDRMVDSAALEYFRDTKTNSLTIGLLKNGKPHFYYYGETEKGNGKLPGAKTWYELGSITKTFTATLLAQAVEDQKVSFTDDISMYLGTQYNNLCYNGIPITLQDLANHTSRIPALPPDIGEKPGYNPLSPESHYDSTMFYAALRMLVIDTVPGKKFLYSNWGVALLGHILEKIYGQRQPDLIRKYITEPLGMHTTGYITNGEVPDAAMPHSENGKRLNLTDQGYFYPAGGLCSTIEDMMSYLRAQLKETNSAIRLTHVPTANNMGLGWGVRITEAGRDFQHNGSEQGSTAHISLFPEINSGCVIFVNNKTDIGALIGSIQKMLRRSL